MRTERAELLAIVILLPFFLWLRGCDNAEVAASAPSAPAAAPPLAAIAPPLAATASPAPFPSLSLGDDLWLDAAVYCNSLSIAERRRPGSPCVAEITRAARACHVKRHCHDAKDAEEVAKASVTACEAPCVDILRGMINFYRSKTDQAE